MRAVGFLAEASQRVLTEKGVLHTALSQQMVPCRQTWLSFQPAPKATQDFLVVVLVMQKDRFIVVYPKSRLSKEISN